MNMTTYINGGNRTSAAVARRRQHERRMQNEEKEWDRKIQSDYLKTSERNTDVNAATDVKVERIRSGPNYLNAITNRLKMQDEQKTSALARDQSKRQALFGDAALLNMIAQDEGEEQANKVASYLEKLRANEESKGAAVDLTGYIGKGKKKNSSEVDKSLSVVAKILEASRKGATNTIGNYESGSRYEMGDVVKRANKIRDGLSMPLESLRDPSVSVYSDNLTFDDEFTPSYSRNLYRNRLRRAYPQMGER